MTRRDAKILVRRLRRLTDADVWYISHPEPRYMVTIFDPSGQIVVVRGGPQRGVRFAREVAAPPWYLQ